MRWTCRCGQMQADLATGHGTHIVCYCRDCQAFARHLGAESILDDGAGTAVYATVPDRLRIVAGAAQLSVLRLSPKGTMRWYAGCCRTPFANTGSTPKMPFVSLILSGNPDHGALGPVRACLHCEDARGPVAGRCRGTNALVLPAVARALRARLTGRHKQTPFFADDGRPVAAPQILSRAERAAATP